MRASQVLQKCLSNSLSGMHALRMKALLNAVQALIVGRRLTLTDVARSWPGAERVRPPLKAFDRLLGNRNLHAERGTIEVDMARWLLRGPRPVILIDWSDLKPDKSWCLLRAAVPVGGRTLTLLDMIFPGKEQGSADAERRFLQQLRKLVPDGATPVLVTDAGFRTPWFRAVSALGWHWVGRLRGATRVKLQDTPDAPEHWHDSRTLHAKAKAAPRELPPTLINRSSPLACRLVLCAKTRKGRRKTTRRAPQQDSRSAVSLKAAAREREPWLIVAAPELRHANARQLVELYARRMQIELAFRDLKSHRYGHALKDSLTRQAPRLQILLLVSTLANFVSWLAGMVCEATGIDHWLWSSKSARKRYSTQRVGREALARGWPLGSPAQWLDLLRSPPTKTLDNMTLQA